MKALAYIVLLVAAMAVAAAVLGLGAQQTAVNPSRDAMKTTSPSSPSKPGAARLSRSAHDITPLAKDRIEELAKKLTPEEAGIILAKGTEPAFCGNLVDNKKDGVYVCRLCGLPLFESGSKFDSGTGWPSFFRPVDAEHVATLTDRSHGMTRDEILCARCGGHLGHVFTDGPRPTGLRFCVNSVSLSFVEKGQPMPPESRPIPTQSAYFAGGCFWGVEDRFQQLPGVINAVSGYMGGKTKNPTYDDICAHGTGHAETVEVVFDPKRITFGELLTWFFKFHDPTQLNRQGPDVGDQYRSAIFAASAEQAEQARRFIEEQAGNERFKGRAIVTQLITPGKDGPADVFYRAEEYHQDYHLKHGGHCPLPER